MLGDRERVKHPNSPADLETMPVEQLVSPDSWLRYTGEHPEDTRFYVVIPAHNEAAIIGRTIRGLSKQIVPPGSKITINIIPNGCTDSTETEAIKARRELKSRVDLDDNDHIEILISPTEKAGKAGALNLGRSLSPTDVVFCMDADTLPSDNSLAKLYALMRANPVCAAAAVMPRRIPNAKDGLLQHMQDYYDATTRDNGAIIGKLMVFRNQSFPDFPLNCMSDDTWLEFTSINLYGPNSVMFLGQHPQSDVGAYYHAPADVREYLGQLLRWEASFQHLMKTQPHLRKASRVADRVVIPDNTRELLAYLKRNYPELPLVDKLLMRQLLKLTRRISKIKGVSERIAGKTHWSSPKSDRVNIND